MEGDDEDLEAIGQRRRLRERERQRLVKASMSKRLRGF